MNDDTTFIIADNQDITRAGLHAYITSLFGESQIVDVSNKKELVSALIASGGRGIVVLDYALFDLGGVDELLIIEKRFNASWLLFSQELSETLIRRLSLEDNIGMVFKESSGDEIRTALRYAMQDRRFLCPQVANLLLTNSSQTQAHSILTATEMEILKLIAQGKSVKEIAVIRISSVHTIITHKKNIFRKLEINTVYEATKYALRAGLVEAAEYYI